jgi:N-carbamoyl-L-amino-acid hydrolase
MDARHDAGLAAAAAALRVEEIAIGEGGVATVGEIRFEPGIPTAVPGRASLVVDLRNRKADSLARMLKATREEVEAVARERGCEVSEEPVWRIEPIAFDPELVRLAGEACERVTGTAFELPSGALHDAASMAPHLPTAMIFSPSIAGVSHAPEEDTAEEDLTGAIEAFGDLANSRLG